MELRTACCLSHVANACVQAALVACCGVLVQVTLATAAVDYRYSCLEGGLSGVLITRGNGLDDFFHGAAHGGASRGVVDATYCSLAGALSGLC